MRIPALRSLLIALCGLFLLSACQSRVEAPPLPLPDLTVGVAPFTQPIQATELLAGFVPDPQGRIPAEALPELDDALAAKLDEARAEMARQIAGKEARLQEELAH